MSCATHESFGSSGSLISSWGNTNTIVESVWRLLHPVLCMFMCSEVVYFVHRKYSDGSLALSRSRHNFGGLMNAFCAADLVCWFVPAAPFGDGRISSGLT